MEEQNPTEQIAPQPANLSPAGPGVPLSPNPQKSSLRKIIKIILMVLLVGGALGLAGVVFVIFSFFNGLQGVTSECSNARTQLYNKEPVLTDQFNKLLLIPDQPNVVANVAKQDGDCIDSLPMVTATKTYTISTTAGSAFDEINSALTQAGYIASKDSIYLPDNPCAYKDKSYKFTSTEPNRDIEITMSCTKYSVNGEDWRQIPVTEATAQLVVSWKYPAK
jgi:hypothetical protein